MKKSGIHISPKSDICEPYQYFQLLFSTPGADLYGWSQPHVYPAGVELFRQDDPATHIYFIESGIVELSTIGTSGKKTIIDLRRRNWLLGVTEICVEEAYAATATTLTRCTIRQISSNEFMDRLTKDGTLSIALIRMLSREVRGSFENITALGSMSAPERLRRFIYELISEEDSDKLRINGKIELPLKSDELAEIVAVTPQHLYRILKAPDLRAHIKQHKKMLTITDPLAFVDQGSSEH